MTKIYGLSPERIYVTYFGGNEKEGLLPDDETKNLWLQHLPPGLLSLLPFPLFFRLNGIIIPQSVFCLLDLKTISGRWELVDPADLVLRFTMIESEVDLCLTL